MGQGTGELVELIATFGGQDGLGRG